MNTGIPRYSENPADYPVGPVDRLMLAISVNAARDYAQSDLSVRPLSPAAHSALSHLHRYATTAAAITRNEVGTFGDDDDMVFHLSEDPQEYDARWKLQLALQLNTLGRHLHRSENLSGSGVREAIEAVVSYAATAANLVAGGPRKSEPAMSPREHARRFIQLEDSLPSLTVGTPLQGYHHMVLRSDQWPKDDALGNALRELDVHRVALFGKLGFDKADELLAEARHELAGPAPLPKTPAATLSTRHRRGI